MRLTADPNAPVILLTVSAVLSWATALLSLTTTGPAWVWYTLCTVAGALLGTALALMAKR